MASIYSGLTKSMNISINRVFKSIAKNWRSYILYVAITLPVLVVFIVTSVSFYSTPLNYDEAYNLQVSAHLAKEGTYSTNGSVFDGTPKPFDPYISTGPTLLLPIALVFKIFGVDVWQFRIVLNIIYLGFCIVVVWVVSKATKRRKVTTLESYLYGNFALLLCLAFLGNAIVGQYGYLFSTALGEPLGLFFIVLSILLLQYGKVRSAALVLGLAVLTKLLLVLLVPFFLVGLFINNKLGLVGKLKHTMITALLIAAPSVLFEVYKFISFGLDPSQYLTNVKEFIKFFKVGGGDPSVAITPLSIMIDRTKSLLTVDYSQFNLTSMIIAGLILLAVFRLIVFCFKTDIFKRAKASMAGINFPVIYVVFGTLIWFGWWLVVSGSPLTRYALIPVTLLIITCVSLMYAKRPAGKFELLAIIAITILLSIVTIINNKTKTTLSSQRESSAKVIKAFGDRQLYHFDWWQNPEVQFLTNKTSIPYDFDSIPKTTVWVLASNLQKSKNKYGYDGAMALCDDVIKIDYYQICKIYGK